MNPFSIKTISVIASSVSAIFDLETSFPTAKGEALVHSPLGESVEATAINMVDSLSDNAALPEYERDELLLMLEAALTGVDLRMITRFGPRSDIPAAQLTEQQTSEMKEAKVVVKLAWDATTTTIRMVIEFEVALHGRTAQDVKDSAVERIPRMLTEMDLPLEVWNATAEII